MGDVAFQETSRRRRPTDVARAELEALALTWLLAVLMLGAAGPVPIESARVRASRTGELRNF